MRVLVVEDERRLANIIRRGLAEDGFTVDLAYDGLEAISMVEKITYNLIILDIMLPKKDGFTVCRDLRAKKISVPILMLTARDSIEDRVKGLDAGADDYQVKPFAFPELKARTRALLRRQTTTKTTRLEAGNLVLDTATREVKRGDRKIHLTAKEYSVLEFFMRHPNTLLTRTTLEENIWNITCDCISNIIDVFVRKLRKKIDEEGEESMIQTVRGVGYRLKTG